MRAAYLGFFAVIIALTVAVHYYFWARLVRDPAWGSPTNTIITIIVIALGALLPIGMIAGRTMPRWLASPFAVVAFVWMGTLFFLLMFLFAADVVRMIWSLTSQIANRPIDDERRQLLARGAVAVAGVATAGLAGVSLKSGLGEVEIREVEVRVPRLPPELEGMSIVQLTDIHVGSMIGDKFIKMLVEKANREKPDLIAITGDLVDGSVAELGSHVAPLGNLKSRYGSFFVTGNHEYYSGADEWLAYLSQINIRALRNERVEIGDTATFDLAGVDDSQAHRFGGNHGASFAKIVKDRDPERELILLAHQPKAIDDAAVAGASLQLSGHTHGGQIWPFNGFVRLVQPYTAGLYRHNENTQIYVSRGCGHWGPPMRFLAPSEITKIVLVRG